MAARALNNARIDTVPESVTLKLLDRIQELRAKGKKIILLNKGEPENPPSYAVELTKKALDDGNIRMTSTSGLLELRQAVAKVLEDDDPAIRVDPSSEIIITPGSKFAAFLGVASTVQEGDEVLLPDPIFPPLRDIVSILGGKPIEVRLDEKDGFHHYFEKFEAKITKKTKMIVINYPNNPTGATLEKRDIERLLEIAEEHDLLVLADEIYEKIVFDTAHKHILSFPEYRKRTMMTSGFTKTYGMGGWRLGYLVTNQQLAERALKVLRNSITFMPAFVQKAGALVMGDPRSRLFISQNLETFRIKRDYFVKELNKISGISVVPPAGSFYLFPNISGLGISSATLAEKLIVEEGIAVLPGNAFNPWWDDHIRISCTEPMEEMELAVQKIRQFVERQIIMR